MLSAFLTVQQVMRQNEHYGEDSRISIDTKEVLLPAARAILFHVCPPNEPSVGKQNDPLLSFLTMLDELCAWEPSFNYDPMPLKPALTDEHFNLVPLSTDHFRPYEKIAYDLTPSNGFITFIFTLCAEHDAIDKNCTSILRLAQTFGLLKPGQTHHQACNPKAIVALEQNDKAKGQDKNKEKKPNYSILDLINYIDEAATYIDNKATPLLHDWTYKMRKPLEKEGDEQLVIESKINPFRYIDIRDHFEKIETYIANRVHYGQGKWAIGFEHTNDTTL